MIRFKQLTVFDCVDILRRFIHTRIKDVLSIDRKNNNYVFCSVGKLRDTVRSKHGGVLI